MKWIPKNGVVNIHNKYARKQAVYSVKFVQGPSSNSLAIDRTKGQGSACPRGDKLGTPVRVSNGENVSIPVSSFQGTLANQNQPTVYVCKSTRNVSELGG
eukprot:203300_1